MASRHSTHPEGAAPPYGGLRWRNIGPHRGGRVVAVAGHPTERATFYMGSTGGGVWRTANAGVTWENLTDGQLGSASVGALAVAPSDPSVLYVGMGESCIRGNVSFGDGVYRSLDGGRTWRHMGLRASEHIARIRVHPADPGRVYVAVLGHAFGPHPERGVYRSTDGGERFERVLFRDEDTGAIDLSLDPRSPSVLYAALWQARRTPWSMTSGGPGSGLFRSLDGGSTWEELTRRPGLPAGPLGRIGVAASPARPGRVWALVEAEEGGVFRSDDYGETWERTNGEPGPRSRPWYYSHIFADPVDAETVYALATNFHRSQDGGRTFRTVATPHSDHHDLWIDPADPRRMIHGADGGASISLDGGRTWSSIYNQPTAEIYHVAVDTRFPYRVYGSQQDNTTISLPSRSDSAGIGEREWYDVGGAESGHVAVRPDDPDVVYAGSSGGGEGGRITRYDHRTRQMRDISAWPEQTAGRAASEYTYRFQWTSPIVLSPHDPNVLYSCGNRVFRTRDEGESWEVISPDLTRDDPERQGPSGGITRDHTGVEVYCTIFAFAESPRRPGLLWAGSDDGLVHVSEDAGATWRQVTPPALPEWSTVTTVEPSHHDERKVFVAAHRYRLDDRRPLVFRSDDLGRTWHALGEGVPADEYVRVVREDPEQSGLVYLGTERGVYVSFDDGEHFAPLSGNLPVVPVHDLAVAGDDLVAATHGRGFWILDDVTPLRQYARHPEEEGPRLFAPRDTVRMRLGGWLLLPANMEEEAGASAIELPEGTSYYLKHKPRPGEAAHTLTHGENLPYGVLIHYALPEEAARVRLTVRDEGGEAVAVLASDDPDPAHVRPSAAPGAHRTVWNLRLAPARRVESGLDLWKGEPVCAPHAPPGRYRLELEVEGKDGETVRREASFRLLPDPRASASESDLRDRFALEVAIRDALSAVNDGLTRLRRLGAALEAAAAALPAGAEGLGERLKRLRGDLDGVEAGLTQTRWRSRDDGIAYAPGLDSEYVHLFRVVTSADARPTRPSRELFALLEERRARALAEVERVEGEARALEAEVVAAGVGLFSALGAAAGKETVSGAGSRGGVGAGEDANREGGRA
ncbi:MAG: glycosyl hydrolase [Firmicutes bacterium]|nr:glycosyl hydrolase [Bacillota bacterium]